MRSTEGGPHAIVCKDELITLNFNHHLIKFKINATLVIRWVEKGHGLGQPAFEII